MKKQEVRKSKRQENVGNQKKKNIKFEKKTRKSEKVGNQKRKEIKKKQEEEKKRN